MNTQHQPKLPLNLTPHSITIFIGAMILPLLTPQEVMISTNNLDKDTLTQATETPDGGKVRLVVIPPEEKSARLISATNIEPLRSLCIEFVLPIIRKPYHTSIVGLPADKTKPIIVSTMVADFLIKTKGWDGTVLVPASGPDHAVRDKTGRICGVVGLHCYMNCDKNPHQ